ncbi:MAG: hypothetical protein JW816_02700 [Candidatus Buchananbacteria bacterium]|nr:hypothetical protein [Candidatus Buchananbacteria bacterium]
MNLKKWPTWLKTLLTISIILSIIDIVLTILVLSISKDPIGRAIVGGLLLSFLVIIIGMWLLGFLLNYFKKKSKVITNIISIVGLVIFGLTFSISTLGLLRIMPFDRWDIAGWFAWPFQLIIVIFFMISTIVLNKK